MQHATATLWHQACAHTLQLTASAACTSARLRAHAGNAARLPVDSLHTVLATGLGAAASSDVEIKFSGFVPGGAASADGADQPSGAIAMFGACVLSNGTAGSGIGLAITVSRAPNGTGRTANIYAGACKGELPPPAPSGGPQSIALVEDETDLTVRILADRSVADFFVSTRVPAEHWRIP